MYKLELEHTFSAAHQLTNAYDDKCNNFSHGHNFVTFVTIITDKLVNNMVVDFTQVKEIIDKLDHKNLNEILDFEPTAENLANYLREELKKLLLNDNRSIEIQIKIFEGAKASITCF